MKIWKLNPLKPHIKAIVSSAMLLSPLAANALPPCANSTGMGGQLGLNVEVDVSPSDLANNSAEAWKNIAEAAQEKYGEYVAHDAGMVQLTVVVETFGVTAPVGNFPITFNGGSSIGQSILMERGLQNAYPDAMNDMACDPDKNDGKDCCDECAMGFAMLSPLDIFNTGYLVPGTKALKRPEGATFLNNRKRLAA